MSFEPPILLKREPHLKSSERFYYEVASNGVFQVKDTPLFRSVTRVTRDLPGLHPSHERLDMHFPPLPRDLLEDVIAFFDAVYRLWEGEAIAMLFYDPETRRYRADVPRQRISGYRDYRGRLRAYMHLDYESAPRPAGHLPFGTIHSHADLSAYSSGVDCDDERFGDGLHVVYGHFGSASLSRCAAFVANGRRFRLEPDHVLPGCGVPDRPARADWMERVTFEETRSWAEATESWLGAGVSPPLIGCEGPHEA